MTIRQRITATPAAIALLAAQLVSQAPAEAARHHFYVGGIVSISASQLTIHSKTHNANYHFVIDSGTEWLQTGKPITRTHFSVGAYVTVSYSPGPRSTMIAWHVSLRQRH